jgi:hypothetical protein
MTDATRVAERHQRLWPIPAGPVVWGAHFMLCYITAAIWCAKAADVQAPLTPVRTAIAVYTLVALAAIAWIGWIGYRAHSLGGEAPPHDADSPQDRHRFIGFATLLLAGLSFVSTIYSALVAVFLSTCE